MESQTKICQSCKTQFTIEPEDFEFYEKIKVPAPLICHECRSQERTAFRNESTLYKRKCDFSDKNIISIYSQDKPYKVYDQNIWWGDEWDALEYGQEFDFSKPFFEQYRELLLAVPRLSIINRQSTNSDYCNYSNSNKDCYLCFGGHENENCGFCWFNWKDKDCFDCLSIIKSELSYACNFGSGLYKCGFLEYSFDCVECFFGYNLRGCQNCFLSANLRNKQYYFLNNQLTKEEYEQKIKEFWEKGYEGISETIGLFAEQKLKAIRNPLFQKNCTNCSGGDIVHSKNIQFGFDGEYSEDSKYAYPKFSNIYNCMDTNKMGYDRSDYCYMTIGCAGLNNCKFCDSCWNNFNLTYCNLCFSSSDLFGCIGLKHKKYCILNKEYSEEEYKLLILKIIDHMKFTGEWGNFFPPFLSTFSYNETTAQEYTSINKNKAKELDYLWKDAGEKNIQITMSADQVPGHIKNVDDSILQQVIGCEHEGKCNEQCTTAFKIIPSELEFYRKMNLPLPRLCPNCRHYQRIKQRNPLKLWERKCMCNGKESVNSNQGIGKYQNTSQHSHGDEPCLNEFETTYSPERKEIIYCEQCYQQEVV